MRSHEEPYDLLKPAQATIPIGRLLDDRTEQTDQVVDRRRLSAELSDEVADRLLD